MKIFITVGTTPFDRLLSYCDDSLDVGIYDVKAQISNLAKYVPSNFESFDYTSDVRELYDWADIIIAHAGSGTLFQLLEMRKKVIFVPNSIHKDDHQKDLCRFVQDNNFSFVLSNYKELNHMLERIENYKFNFYHKEKNTIAEYIIELIRNK